MILAAEIMATCLLVFCIRADNIKFTLPPNHGTLLAVQFN
jgi:hypothetical protein